MKIRFLAVAALLSYTTGAFAGGPLPPQIQAELTAMSSASTFSIAGAQEVPFYQKLHRRINRREVIDEERNAAYQQAISDKLSFVESQRHRVVTLTEQQRKALITLLLDNGNYVQNTLFTVGAPMTCGVDVQSESMKLTVVFHSFFVSVFTLGRMDNGLFNDRGKSQLREWIKSTGVDVCNAFAPGSWKIAKPTEVCPLNTASTLSAFICWDIPWVAAAHCIWG